MPKRISFLKIDRRCWLRGEGVTAGRLYRRRDKKFCPVGFYLHACGVPLSAIAGVGAINEQLDPYLPSECLWLKRPGVFWELTYANDGNLLVGIAEREKVLAELFLHYGKVKLEFVNGGESTS